MGGRPLRAAARCAGCGGRAGDWPSYRDRPLAEIILSAEKVRDMMKDLEYMYPTEYMYPAIGHTEDWVCDMLARWQKSSLRYLCFPFLRFHVHTLPARGESFWLYMYYRMSKTDDPTLKGKIRFRVRVVDWDEDKFKASNVCVYNFPNFDQGDERTMWFKCDRIEEIKNKDDKLLSFHDFRHVHNKLLGSAMRSSIAPVICQSKIVVIRRYPEAATKRQVNP